jgi:hypothetical protein
VGEAQMRTSSKNGGFGGKRIMKKLKRCRKDQTKWVGIALALFAGSVFNQK